MDAVANFSYTTVTVAPSPAASGTSLTVADPEVLPAPPFNAVVWPAGAPIPLATQAEVVRVTANASGVLTIVRDVETGGITRSIRVGDQFMAAITAGLLEQIGSGGGGSALLKANNLSDVASVPAARTSLGLGSAALQPTSAFDAAGTAAADVSALEGAVTTALAAKAPLASPALTGTPTAPTQAEGNNSTRLATTAFVTAANSTLAPLASPALTGNPTAPTQAEGNSTTRLATTAFVATATGALAPLASPALTGNPTAPTQSVADNSTRVATTAFVTTAVAAVSGGSVSTLNGQSTSAGEEALAAFKALPTVDRSVHTSNTAFGWNALKALTGLTGVFPLTSGSIVGATVLNMTGVEGKAGPIWAGGTSNTPMIVFRKLTAGQTGLKEGVAYFVVSGTANAFSVSLTKGGAAVAVAGAALATDTEVALLRSTEDNTAIGSQAGKSLTTGGGNTLVGENAGVNLTTGEENTVYGCEALAAQTTVGSTVAIGFRALSSNTTGTGNTAGGTSAMEASSTSSESTAFGFKAMQTAKSSKSVAFGYETLKVATGKGNTAFGIGAGKAVSTGEENVFLGMFAGNTTTTGESNVAIGTEALSKNVVGSNNVAVGNLAGKSALGSGNVFLGGLSGREETGSNKLYIDNSATTTPLILGDFSTSSLTLSRTGGKIGLYGVAPVARAAAITSPAAELAALKTAVDAIRVALTNIGVTS